MRSPKTAGWRFTGFMFMIALLVAGATGAGAQPAPLKFVGVGDSIGEGVQSGDASWRTQPSSYLNWVAYKMGAPFPLPLIWSSPLGFVGDTNLRPRLDPTVRTFNLAVSGADVGDVLNRRANANSVAEIDTETDLVLFPWLGSQIEIVEQIRPDVVACWIGNNDSLGAVISWDHLDASQLTSEAAFAAAFNEIASRLDASSGRVVFINLPDVTSIGFLMTPEDLEYFLGSDYGLPDGHMTSVVVMALLRLGLDDGSLLADPNFVLDPNEIALISNRIDAFNQTIAQAAAGIGAPVVDVHTIFAVLSANPLDFFGFPVSRRLLSGLFSLDGVHPSNFAHAIVADQTIAALNAAYGMSVPRLDPLEMIYVFLSDPHIDKDRDGRAQGRALAGLVETLGPALGLTGDPNDFDPSQIAIVETSGSRFLDLYQATRGTETKSHWNRLEILDAFRNVFASPFR